MGIPIKIYSVDSVWEAEIKNNPLLTKEEKRRIIREAHIGAFLRTFVSLIGTIILASILMGIIYLISSIF